MDHCTNVKAIPFESYVKTPHIVQAFQAGKDMEIETKQGNIEVIAGEWVVQDNQGYIYICKSEEFANNFEPQTGIKYVQEFNGQHIHIAHSYNNGIVSQQALCGRTPSKRGTWRLTVNIPIGSVCDTCSKLNGRVD